MRLKQELIKNRLLIGMFIIIIALCALVTVIAINRLDALVANTSAQRELTQQQLENTSKQLKVAEDQLTVAKRQLKISAQQLTISRRTLAVATESRDISSTILDETRSQHSLLQQSLSMQKQILMIAQAILQETKAINHKIPESFFVVP